MDAFHVNLPQEDHRSAATKAEARMRARMATFIVLCWLLFCFVENACVSNMPNPVREGDHQRLFLEDKVSFLIRFTISCSMLHHTQKETHDVRQHILWKHENSGQKYLFLCITPFASGGAQEKIQPTSSTLHEISLVRLLSNLVSSDSGYEDQVCHNIQRHGHSNDDDQNGQQ